jgi:hypothetical protein
MDMRSCRLAWIALVLAGFAGDAHAQQVIAGNPTGQVLLTTQYQVSSTYDAILARLTTFYDEQVGRKLAVAFPEIAPRQHYDVWHDMWVGFSESDPIIVTMKRPADSITSRLVKSWMLAFAGRIGAEVPIQYRELPVPVTAEAEVYATPKDFPVIFKAIPSIKAVSTWEHLGIAVSAAPMFSVAMDAAGSHGVHHVKLIAENAAALRQLNAALAQGMQRPCICGVFSETTEVEADVYAEVQSQTAMIGTHTAGIVFAPDATRKHEEDVVKARPEMKKRLTEAAGYYDVKFRPDKSYPRVVLTWIELQGYSRETKKHQAERVLAHTPITAARVPPAGAPPLNARVKLDSLQPGAYRVRLEGDGPGGTPILIDERTLWFDGKRFEEL